MWNCDPGFERRNIEFDFTRVASVRVGLDRLEAISRAVSQIRESPGIGGEDAGLCAHLDRHVDKYNPILDLHRFSGWAMKFQCLISSAISPPAFGQCQRSVPRIHTLPNIPVEDEFDRVWHLQPSSSTNHAGCVIARAC